MKDRKKAAIISIVTIIFASAFFTCCGVKAPQQVEYNSQNGSCDGLYMSITYGCNNEDNYTGREMVFYSYNLESRELTKEATLPYDAKYAVGVVAKESNTIYYSRKSTPETPSANDSLCAYDISTGAVTVLETENFSYNEITMIDSDSLLVMAVTEQHPIIPAIFNLKNRTFTYMANVNKEPLSLYTNGDTLLNYDYNTKSFVNIFQKEEDRYSSDYCAFKSEIGTYISIVKDDLKKDPDKVFRIDMLQGHFIDNAVLVSDNQLLVERTDDYFDEQIGELISERSFFLLTFEDTGNITFVQTDPPFPVDGVRKHGYRTPDGGKTWYLILGEKSSEKGGLYSYSTETNELTPILLNNPSIQGYTINFSFIPPG